MKHKIIKTENYLLIVDDSQITEGDYCLANAKTYNNEIVTYRKSPCPPPFVSNLNILKKIIAHLPLNNSPILEGVDLLPPIFIHYENGIEEYEKSCNQLYKEWLVIGYKSGYNKHAEKYKYTEEDIRLMYDKSCGLIGLGYLPDQTENNIRFEGILQSLQQPKMPIGFNLEAKDTYIQNGVLVKSQWVGEYIY